MYTTDDAQHSPIAISLKQNGNSISILTPVSILEFQKAKILRNDLAYSKQHWTAANILFFVVKDWANFIK